MDAGWAECPGRSTGRCVQSEPPKKWARTNTPGPASTDPKGRRIRRSLVGQRFWCSVLVFGDEIGVRCCRPSDKTEKYLDILRPAFG